MPGTGTVGWLPGWVRSLRFVLLVLLVASAVFTVVALPAIQRAVAEGRLSDAVLWVPPGLLTTFVVVFAGYRFALVRAGRYPAGRAFLQVGLVALVAAVVVGMALGPLPATEAERGPLPLDRPLASGDPVLRALAAEAVRGRPRAEALRHVPRLIELVEDPSPAVRREARASLATLAGRDVGAEGRGASARWREVFAAPTPAVP